MSRRTIDADVVLAFDTGDDPEWSPRCRRLFERVERGDEVVFLPEAALGDAIRVLASFRRWPAGRIAAFAGAVLALSGVRMGRKDLLWAALSRFRDGGLDFQAALIAAETAAMGLGEIYSRDPGFDRAGGVARVEP